MSQSLPAPVPHGPASTASFPASLVLGAAPLPVAPGTPAGRRCAVVEAVRADLLARSQVGMAKYGHTLDENPLTLREWLQHAYEECLDQANYLKRSIMEIDAREQRTA